jgi:hypothetical protein
MLVHSHPFETPYESDPIPSSQDLATSLELGLPGVVISDPPDGPPQVTLYQRFSEEGHAPETKAWQLVPETKEITLTPEPPKPRPRRQR